MKELTLITCTPSIVGENGTAEDVGKDVSTSSSVSWKYGKVGLLVCDGNIGFVKVSEHILPMAERTLADLGR